MSRPHAVPHEKKPPSALRGGGAPQGLAPEVAVRSHGASAKGTRRDMNQDQFLVADVGRSVLVRQTSLSWEDHSRILGPPQGRLVAVADGVSGNPAGEIASSVAVDALIHYVVDVMPWFLRLEGGRDDDLEDELAAAIERCQSRVQAASRAEPGHEAMGTTLTMAYVAWPRAWVVHLGDSRGYLLRRGHLARITRDHTVARQLQSEGVLGREEAEASRWRNVLWNAIGGAERSDPDAYRLELEEGDRLLLCTDGLTDALSDEEIAVSLAADAAPEDLAARLVDEARTRESHDDVTVLVTAVG
jgi:serine/threonine protein phosphatase PrpC